jgi:hypothetical protein
LGSSKEREKQMKKKPNIKDKIDALAQEGLEVDIIHDRVYSTPKKFDDYPRLEPCGGVTTAYIIDKETDEVIVSATAECSRHENYNKKIGGHIALGRAIKEAKKRGRVKASV